MLKASLAAAARALTMANGPRTGHFDIARSYLHLLLLFLTLSAHVCRLLWLAGDRVVLLHVQLLRAVEGSVWHLVATCTHVLFNATKKRVKIDLYVNLHLLKRLSDSTAPG